MTVHYTGKLASNGKQFDSSIGGEPISFELGRGLVIKGWEQGLIGSCKGEKATLTIPSELGYGAKGTMDTSKFVKIVCESEKVRTRGCNSSSARYKLSFEPSTTSVRFVL